MTRNEQAVSTYINTLVLVWLTVVGHPKLVLRTEVEFSIRVVYTLNCWPVSPSHNLFLFYLYSCPFSHLHYYFLASFPMDLAESVPILLIFLNVFLFWFASSTFLSLLFFVNFQLLFSFPSFFLWVYSVYFIAFQFFMFILCMCILCVGVVCVLVSVLLCTCMHRCEYIVSV